MSDAVLATDVEHRDMFVSRDLIADRGAGWGIRPSLTFGRIA